MGNPVKASQWPRTDKIVVGPEILMSQSTRDLFTFLVARSQLPGHLNDKHSLLNYVLVTEGKPAPSPMNEKSQFTGLREETVFSVSVKPRGPVD